MNKRLFIALIALLLALTPALAAAEAAEDAEAFTPAQVRYAFEHNMLPRFFYEVPDRMLEIVSDPGLYAMWASIATENGVDPTYPEADYVTHVYDLDDGGTLVQVELPAPDANLLCYRIYFYYNPATGQAGYYTAESDTFTPDACFICAWGREGTHFNYGACDVLDRTADDYAQGLQDEANLILSLASDGEPGAQTAPAE